MNSQLGNKPDNYRFNVQNADTASIPSGTPVFYVFNGTADGVGVVLPATGGASKQTFFAGVMVEAGPTVVNDFGTCQVWGFVNFAIVGVATRSASSANWLTQSMATGLAVSVNTVWNAFQTYAQASGALTIQTATSSTDTVAANLGPQLPQAVLAQSFSIASSASATSDTRTVITSGLKVLLRAL